MKRRDLFRGMIGAAVAAAPVLPRSPQMPAQGDAIPDGLLKFSTLVSDEGSPLIIIDGEAGTISIVVPDVKPAMTSNYPGNRV